MSSPRAGFSWPQFAGNDVSHKASIDPMDLPISCGFKHLLKTGVALDLLQERFELLSGHERA